MSLGDWLDERTGYRRLLDEALDEPVPGGARWAYVWGSALSVTFVTQAISGALLMTAYQPSATSAWSSVNYISTAMTWGWIIRGLHHYGAQAMVILLAMHLGQTAIYGAYKKPREMNWLLGLALMGLTLGFALTGYLLPWDQKGYWATKVATNIAGTFPVIGAWLQSLLVGGADYGHQTLTRFYTLHVFVLPAALVALLVAHVALFRKHGVTPPQSADVAKVDRFFPKQLAFDLVVAMAVLAVTLVFTFRHHGAHLDAPADPSSDYPARPEWYFLALFEALKYVPGHLEWIVAAGLPALILGYLVALPFLDRKPGASLRQRAPLLAPLGVLGLGAVALTWLSLSADRGDADLQAALELAEARAARSRELAADGVPPDGPLAMMQRDPRTRGPALYERHCAACHHLDAHDGTKLGPEGDAQTAPNLSGFGTTAWVLAVLDHPDAPDMFGHTPFAAQMPSFTRPPTDPEEAAYFSAMKKEDQDAIAAFLAAEARGAGEGKGMPGEKLVSQRCTSCHRLDGKTDDEGSLAPELRGWGSLGWIRAQIANPGSGKTYPPGAMDEALKGHMPAFEDDLSPQDLDLLAQWLVDQMRPPQ